MLWLWWEPILWLAAALGAFVTFNYVRLWYLAKRGK